MDVAELFQRIATAAPDTPIEVTLANGQTRTLRTVAVEMNEDGSRRAVVFTLDAE